MTFKELYFLLKFISSNSILLILLAGIFTYSKHKNDPLRYYFYFVCFCSAVELGLGYIRPPEINTSPYINSFIIIEGAFYLWFYNRLIANRFINKVTPYLIIGYVLTALYWSRENFFDKYNSDVVTYLECLLIICYVSIYIYTYISRDQIDGKNLKFIILSIGVLTYFVVSIIIGWGFNETIFNTNPYLANFVHHIVNTVCNLIYAYSFICRSQSKVLYMPR